MLAWAGAASQGADVSLARMLEAGANCLPVAVLFLGLGALALALAPRAGTTIAYAPRRRRPSCGRRSAG